MWEWILGVWGGGRNIKFDQAEVIDIGPLGRDLKLQLGWLERALIGWLIS